MAQTIVLQDDEEIIKKSDLEILLTKVEEAESLIYRLNEAQKKTAILGRVSFGVMSLIGLIDPKTKKVWKNIANGTESPINKIIKGVGNTTVNLIKLQGFSSKETIAIEMKKNYGFIEEFLPLMNDFDFNDAQFLQLPPADNKQIDK